MTKGLTVFLVQLFGISAILFGALYMLSAKGIVNFPLEPMILTFALLFGITAVSHVILLSSAKRNPRTFTYSFMFISVVRLIIYGLFIILYGYKHRDFAKVFAISFFLLYLIYTAFEIRSVLSYLKGK